jgi:hypothetical protein
MSRKYWGWWNNSDSDDDVVEESSPIIYGKRYKSSLGWSSGKLASTTTSYTSNYYGYGYDKFYSSSIDKKVSDLSFEERQPLVSLVSRAYKAVRDMVIILDFPYQVIIKFSNYDCYEKQPGHKTIFVSTKILDDKTFNENEKINIICGLGIHEASHLKYTDRKIIEAGKKKYLTYDQRVVEIVQNIIEDERVEDKLLTERPGYSEFIRVSKEYLYTVFNKNLLPPINDDEKKLYYTILLIRYPDKIDNFDFLDNNKDIFEGIRKIITPLPINSKETVLKTKEIVDLLNISSGNLRSNFLEKLFNSYTISMDPDANTVDNYIIETYMSNLFDSDMAMELALGGAEYGENPSVYFKKEKGNQTEYNKLVEAVSKYVPSIRKVLKGHDKNYDFTIHGCRHGLLDTTKLAEAYQGVQQVYIRQGHVRTNKTTLCILIDESGSMGDNNYPSECAYVARLAAVLINESLKNIPGVDLYIYGHTADINEIGETEMLIYREGNKYKDDSSFTNIRGREQNRDGTAIYEAAKRVRKYTDSHTIMLILSDGEPYALGGYCDDVAIKDVKNNVELVEKLDFDVIQVSIQRIDRAKEMFKNVICLYNDLANLPKELSLLVKKLIIADKKTVIT